jgi:hypothetical protein
MKRANIMQSRLGLDLEVPDEFGYWLAGFTDGEGCFAARIQSFKDGSRALETHFTIGLRADDRAILEEIQRVLGIGTIKTRRGHYSPNPQAIYGVYCTADFYHIIVPLFERYPLRAKKAKDFQIWKRIVYIEYHEGGHHGLGKDVSGRTRGSAPLPESYWQKIGLLVSQLREGRKFKP